jgi:hypothetical protein
VKSVTHRSQHTENDDPDEDHSMDVELHHAEFDNKTPIEHATTDGDEAAIDEGLNAASKKASDEEEE